MKDYPHIQVKVICDSAAHCPCQSLTDRTPPIRLITFELTYPRYIHAELMTHRVFSRNAQSSRAIPVEKRLQRVRENPVMPIRWGANQKGMQASMDDVEDPIWCESIWESAAAEAERHADRLLGQNLHKQWVNRLLEPFDTITTIVTGTEWENFFALRCHKDAQPEFQWLAWKMADAYYTESSPKLLDVGQWHPPYVGQDEPADFSRVKASVARCARVSYLNHDQTKPDLAKDEQLHDRLLADGHMSPFEHQAHVGDGGRGNFRPPWVQYRKILPPGKELRTFDYAQALKDRPY